MLCFWHRNLISLQSDGFIYLRVRKKPNAEVHSGPCHTLSACESGFLNAILWTLPANLRRAFTAKIAASCRNLCFSFQMRYSKQHDHVSSSCLVYLLFQSSFCIWGRILQLLSTNMTQTGPAQHPPWSFSQSCEAHQPLPSGATYCLGQSTSLSCHPTLLEGAWLASALAPRISFVLSCPWAIFVVDQFLGIAVLSWSKGKGNALPKMSKKHSTCCKMAVECGWNPKSKEMAKSSRRLHILLLDGQALFHRSRSLRSLLRLRDYRVILLVVPTPQNVNQLGSSQDKQCLKPPIGVSIIRQ